MRGTVRCPSSFRLYSSDTSLAQDVHVTHKDGRCRPHDLERPSHPRSSYHTPESTLSAPRQQCTGLEHLSSDVSWADVEVVDTDTSRDDNAALAIPRAETRRNGHDRRAVGVVSDAAAPATIRAPGIHMPSDAQIIINEWGQRRGWSGGQG